MTNDELIKIELIGSIPNSITTKEVLKFVESYGKMTKVIFQSIIKKAAKNKNQKEWREHLSQAFELRVKTLNDKKMSERDANFFFFGTALNEAMELEEFKKYISSNKEKLEKVVQETKVKICSDEIEYKA